MEKKFLQLKDIGAYGSSYALSNYVWDIVVCWKFFEKDTIGKQFAKAIDSVSANIAEGFGRFLRKKKFSFTVMHMDLFLNLLIGMKKPCIANF